MKLQATSQLLFFFFFTTKIFGQNPTFTLRDTVFANQLLKESSSLLSKGKFTDGIAKADTALLILEQVFGKESKEVADAIHQKGNNLSGLAKFEEAGINYEKALTIRLKVLGENSPSVAGSYNNISTNYRNLSEYDKSIEYALKAYAVNAKIKNGQTLSMAITLANLGRSFTLKGEFDKAIDYHSQSLLIRQNLFGNQHSTISATYSDMGNIYFYKTEFKKAIDYYEKALAIQVKNGVEDLSTAGYLGNLGNCYNYIDELDKAQTYFFKELSIKTKFLPIESSSIATSFSNIGMVFISKNQLDSAMAYLQKSLSIQEKVLNTNNIGLTQVYINLGRTCFLRKEYEKSIAFYEKCLTICLKIYGKKNPRIAEVYTRLGSSYYELGLNNKADSCHLNCFQSSGYIEKNNFSNIPDLGPLIASLKNLGEIKKAEYKKNNQKSGLMQALDFTQQAINAHNFQNKNVNNEREKALRNSHNYTYYEDALYCLSFFGDSDSLSRAAFDYFEQSKAKLLQSDIQETNALYFAGIDDSLLKKEQFLRLAVAANEKQRQELLTANNKETDKNVLAISNKLFDLKEEYIALKNAFEKKYPDYYRLKYDLKTVGVEEIQKTILSNNQTLLEYFVGDSSIFVFTINKDNYKFTKIPLDFNLYSLVRLMRDGIVAKYDLTKSDDERADAPTHYTEGATKLYDKLIRPFKTDLKKELIIIPDGILGTIPFEALISEKDETPYYFNAHKYLIDAHQVSYAYSATLLKDVLTKKHKQEPKNLLLAMAPFSTADTTLTPDLFVYQTIAYGDTSGKRSDIVPLKYSGQEVANITKLMNGTAFYGIDASESKFTKIAANYRIIHLATHSQINDKSSDYSFLAFNEIKDSIENELLYVRELYNLSLNADLVVLSACETGVGKVQKGEGIISLARAFTYAGAKSIVTTLWQVNDQKSKILMIDFYKHLKRGLPKREALWRAKHDFIRKTNGDPYFWAGYIGIGNMNPIKVN